MSFNWIELSLSFCVRQLFVGFTLVHSLYSTVSCSSRVVVSVRDWSTFIFLAFEIVTFLSVHHRSLSLSPSFSSGFFVYTHLALCAIVSHPSRLTTVPFHVVVVSKDSLLGPGKNHHGKAGGKKKKKAFLVQQLSYPWPLPLFLLESLFCLWFFFVPFFRWKQQFVSVCFRVSQASISSRNQTRQDRVKQDEGERESERNGSDL